MARKAKSLDKLLEQVNAAAPNRSKLSDGWIGDAAHAASKSDHNPNSAGVVQAIDITHDPRGGLDSYKLADRLRITGDRRIKYIISNRKIANPGQPWRVYNGSNPHDHHVHVSVVDDARLYDDASPWTIGALTSDPAAPPLPKITVLFPGSKDPEVNRLKEALVKEISAEIGYGPVTEGAVRGFQKKNALTVDGVVGRQTQTALKMVPSG